MAAKEILSNIIHDFNPELFKTFFRQKNTDFAPISQPLEHYQDKEFTDFYQIGEINFREASQRLVVIAIKILIPLSERSGKKAQYEKAKKILRELNVFDAGIFIFYDQSKNFRFSLIYAESIETRRRFNNFRRFTYFVSKELTNKTFLVRVGDGDFASLDKIKDAFSVEKVTKEFYEQYRKLFEGLVDDLDKNHVFRIVASKNQIDTADFAKKLLGQIVFLYFLQKKGWLGVPQDKRWGDGDKNFISNLCKQAVKNNENFYNDYLEILFYDTLNNANREGADPSFSKYFNCRIPFLNGGLFEPEYNWRGTKIYLENSIFKNILEVFDRFNFTVEEESPDDKEVAVDPEMLGKVFENLLPENLRKGQGTYYTPREIVHYMCQESLINYLVTETKVDTDKIKDLVVAKNFEGQGSVEAIDKALQNIKVCDPACGSGAFLVGMLNEIVSARRILGQESEYKLKKETIQNCIYGVDIDPGAVEIAKLRLWLSLVVDYELKDIEPLPNLDYKIMCGNSLLEELTVGDDSIKLFDEKLINAKKDTKKEDILFEHIDRNAKISKPEQLQELLRSKQRKLLELNSKNQLTRDKRKELEQEIDVINKKLNPKFKKLSITPYQSMLFDENAGRYLKELGKLHKQYFNEYDPAKKKEKRRQIEDIELEFIKSSIDEKVKNIEVQIRNLNMQIPEDRKKHSGLMKKKLEYMSIPIEIHRSRVRPYFLWKLNFFEVFQEKGGFDIVIANPPYIKEYVNRSAFDGLRKSPYYKGKMDLWYLFACRGIDVSRSASGIVTFIAQNNWVTSHGASKMRNKVITDAQILSLIDFGDFKIFEAGIQTMVMIFRKKTDLNSYSFDCRKLHGNDLELKDVVSLLNKEENTKAEYLTPTITRSNFIDRTLTFSNSDVELILEKIALSANFHLDPKKEVAQGIVCPQDYVNKSSQKVLGENFKVGEGIFTLSDNELKALKLSKKELSLVKPLYTTDELNRWWGNAKNRKWIIYAGSSFKNKKKIEEYPVIKTHLDRFNKVITSDNKPYGLHRARNAYFFTGEKILAVRKCARPAFTYINFDSYVTATFYVIKTERINQKYLTGILNSRLITFWLKHRGKMQGTNYQIDKEPIIDLPILKPDQASQDAIADIVTEIINILRSEGSNVKQAKVKECERQIDQMVYKLYGLTKEEIEVVEDSSP